MRSAIIRIFNSDLKDNNDIENLDSDSLSEIPNEVLEEFKNRLAKYDYELTKEKDGAYEYHYTANKNWSLKVVLNNKEITFTAPSTKQFNSSLVFEATQTASELCDRGNLAAYYPKDGEWIV